MSKIILFLAAALLAGCGSRTYDVSVSNQTRDAITLWLTKDGGPAEEGWLSPEQLIQPQHRDKRYDMANVLSGSTGYTGKVSGKFDSGTHAVLRVYRGNFDLKDILRERAAHSDYTLKPGLNDLIAIDEGNQLTLKPAAAPPGAK